jgi:hypothetical protein
MNVIECKMGSVIRLNLETLIKTDCYLTNAFKLHGSRNTQTEWCSDCEQCVANFYKKAFVAHCVDIKMRLQQYVAVNCCQSSNLMVCSRLVSNDESNTEPFRESNRTVSSSLNNDEINNV